MLDDAVAEFELSLMRRPISDNTRKAFAGDVRIFAREMQHQQPALLTSLNPDRIRDFLTALEKRAGANSPKSIERRLTSLKVFFTWLNESGHIATNPTDRIAYRPFLDPLPEFLSEDETARVKKAARAVAAEDQMELRPLTALLLVLDTGMKKGECLNLTVADFGGAEGHDLASGGAPNRVTIRYNKLHLKFKTRTLPLSKEAGKAVAEHVRHYQCRDKIIECTGRNLEYLFNRKVAPKAGLQAVTFEMLRWTAALSDYRAGALTEEQLQHKYGLSPLGWTEMAAKLQRIVAGESPRSALP